MTDYIFSTDRSTKVGFYIPGCGPHHPGGEGGLCDISLTMHGRLFGPAVVTIYDSPQRKLVLFERAFPAEAGVSYEFQFDASGSPNAVLVVSGGRSDKLFIVN